MEKLESERLMSLLRKAMRMLDIKHRDLAMRMGVSPSYLSRLFHGVIDLKLDQLVRMVDALGLRPGEFFRMAYPDTAEPPSSAAVALRGLMPALPPTPAVPPTALEPIAEPPALPPRAALPAYVTAEEVERQIEETVRRLFTELRRGAASPS
jgi:transcriptional regulator with XRE-family HTH domain